jgi:catechol 2,3-dioxygenase-like lactoylglutathione lyase family enzyme
MFMGKDERRCRGVAKAWVVDQPILLNGDGGSPPNRTVFGPATPVFIVSNLQRSISFYCLGLGFECWYTSTDGAPLFAMIGRGAAQIMLKDVGARPIPNAERHGDARWDAFIYAELPEVLAKDFLDRSITLNAPMMVRNDGLTGFEVADPDGYVCFFGHPD